MMIYIDSAISGTGKNLFLLHSTQTSYGAQKYVYETCTIQYEVHPSSSTVMDKEIASPWTEKFEISNH